MARIDPNSDVVLNGLREGTDDSSAVTLDQLNRTRVTPGFIAGGNVTANVLAITNNNTNDGIVQFQLSGGQQAVVDLIQSISGGHNSGFFVSSADFDMIFEDPLGALDPVTFTFPERTQVEATGQLNPNMQVVFYDLATDAAFNNDTELTTLRTTVFGRPAPNNFIRIRLATRDHVLEAGDGISVTSNNVGTATVAANIVAGTGLNDSTNPTTGQITIALNTIDTLTQISSPWPATHTADFTVSSGAVYEVSGVFYVSFGGITTVTSANFSEVTPSIGNPLWVPVNSRVPAFNYPTTGPTVTFNINPGNIARFDGNTYIWNGAANTTISSTNRAAREPGTDVNWIQIDGGGITIPDFDSNSTDGYAANTYVYDTVSDFFYRSKVAIAGVTSTSTDLSADLAVISIFDNNGTLTMSMAWNGSAPSTTTGSTIQIRTPTKLFTFPESAVVEAATNLWEIPVSSLTPVPSTPDNPNPTPDPVFSNEEIGIHSTGAESQVLENLTGTPITPPRLDSTPDGDWIEVGRTPVDFDERYAEHAGNLIAWYEGINIDIERIGHVSRTERRDQIGGTGVTNNTSIIAGSNGLDFIFDGLSEGFVSEALTNRDTHRLSIHTEHEDGTAFYSILPTVSGDPNTRLRAHIESASSNDGFLTPGFIALIIAFLGFDRNLDQLFTLIDLEDFVQDVTSNGTFNRFRGTVAEAGDFPDNGGVGWIRSDESTFLSIDNTPSNFWNFRGGSAQGDTSYTFSTNQTADLGIDAVLGSTSTFTAPANPITQLLNTYPVRIRLTGTFSSGTQLSFQHVNWDVGAADADNPDEQVVLTASPTSNAPLVVSPVDNFDQEQTLEAVGYLDNSTDSNDPFTMGRRFGLVIRTAPGHTGTAEIRAASYGISFSTADFRRADAVTTEWIVASDSDPTIVASSEGQSVPAGFFVRNGTELYLALSDQTGVTTSSVFNDTRNWLHITNEGPIPTVTATTTGQSVPAGFFVRNGTDLYLALQDLTGVTTSTDFTSTTNFLPVGGGDSTESTRVALGTMKSFTNRSEANTFILGTDVRDRDLMYVHDENTVERVARATGGGTFSTHSAFVLGITATDTAQTVHQNVVIQNGDDFWYSTAYHDNVTTSTDFENLAGFVRIGSMAAGNNYPALPTDLTTSETHAVQIEAHTTVGTFATYTWDFNAVDSGDLNVGRTTGIDIDGFGITNAADTGLEDVTLTHLDDPRMAGGVGWARTYTQAGAAVGNPRFLWNYNPSNVPVANALLEAASNFFNQLMVVMFGDNPPWRFTINGRTLVATRTTIGAVSNQAPGQATWSFADSIASNPNLTAIAQPAIVSGSDGTFQGDSYSSVPLGAFDPLIAPRPDTRGANRDYTLRRVLNVEANQAAATRSLTVGTGTPNVGEATISKSGSAVTLRIRRGSGASTFSEALFDAANGIGNPIIIVNDLEQELYTFTANARTGFSTVVNVTGTSGIDLPADFGTGNLRLEYGDRSDTFLDTWVPENEAVSTARPIFQTQLSATGANVSGSFGVLNLFERHDGSNGTMTLANNRITLSEIGTYRIQGILSVDAVGTQGGGHRADLRMTMHSIAPGGAAPTSSNFSAASDEYLRNATGAPTTGCTMAIDHIITTTAANHQIAFGLQAVAQVGFTGNFISTSAPRSSFTIERID